jgi:hypothetical protein
MFRQHFLRFNISHAVDKGPQHDDLRHFVSEGSPQYKEISARSAYLHWIFSPGET